jgi:DNA-binding NtrC family response regulator
LIGSEITLAAQKEGKSVTGLDRLAAERLLSYSWPGNLRELKTVIHTAVALSPGEIILPEAILLGSPTAAPVEAAADGDRTLRTFEQRHIRRVLDELGGNKRRAARALGLSRSTLDRKLGG